MLDKSSMKVAFASMLLVAFSMPGPNAIATEIDNAPSDVSGSAEGTADGGGVVTISVESSMTTAGSGGGDGGGVTSSSWPSRVVNLPAIKTLVVAVNPENFRQD